jgi:F-type H+-transporting ATPase subunit b
MQRLLRSAVARAFLALCIVGTSLVPSVLAQEAAGDHDEPAAEAGAGDNHDGSEGPAPLAVDPDLAIWTVVVFLLLFFILSKFAWPQISAALEERERKIADQLAAAAATHEEAKRLLAEHDARLAATAGEVRAMLEEAKRDAEATKSRVIAEARKAGEDEKNRALLEINRAKEGAVHELATASANVAIDLARKVIQQKITPDEHTTVVREALNRLAPQPSKN